jgi:hypothetical protein
MRTLRLPLAVCGAVLGLGCGTRFPPETLVDDLRVLAITAEPPEVGPGEPAQLSVLYADPQRRTPTTVLWVGCEPDPQDLGRSACNDASFLLKPTAITDYPPGLKLLGFAPKATYRAAATVFDVLAEDDVIRQAGSVGQVLALVIGEAVDPAAEGEQLRGYFERIETKQTQAVVGLTRVLVSQKPVAERNHNPTVGALSVDGVAVPVGARLMLEPELAVALSVQVPDDSREAYTERPASGPMVKTETVIGAWYATSGRFDRERFEVTSAEPTRFTPPGSPSYPEDPLPVRRSGTVWLTVRDNRGGQAFATYPFFVCDHALAQPMVSQLTVDGAGTVLATGQNLEAVLDVLVGGVALGDGGYSSARGGYVGTMPRLTAGRWPVVLRTKGCATLETGLTVDVP